MKRARWIWYNGDFELWHSIKLHVRREDYGSDYPPLWSLSSPYPNVCFYKTYHSDEEECVRFKSYAKGYVRIDGERHPICSEVVIPEGEHEICAVLADESSFPALFVSGRYIVSDETWVADHTAGKKVPVGYYDGYYSIESDPRIFEFSYEKIEPVTRECVNGGVLFDFGRETFARLYLENLNGDVRLSYGESREEALDYEGAVTREKISSKTAFPRPSRAFRYVFADGDGARGASAYAEYEFLPIADKASFRTESDFLNKIWDVCSHTLHLNSREFFLDGIKRDRWVWSGDAYQSYMANNYLYFDPAITRRTLIALLGKPPYEQHINTINDYSLYLIIAFYEYYFNTGDLEFIKIYYERISALYDFVVSRLDENGYVTQREGDWIFIDWADIDKSGPVAAEAILLWRAHIAMASLSELVGLSGKAYNSRAARLKRAIMKDFWREERGAFVDTFASGQENVTRHASIFAIMYGFVSEKRARQIARCVLKNPEVPEITTPYFEFFELAALGRLGEIEAVQKKIESYWGGMIKLGATSIWEQYLPTESGVEHYAMYERRFGRSLCHAWGGGPIYLLGRFSAGVYPTSVAYETFSVEPHRGIYERIDATVPLPDGHSVSVFLDEKVCRVKATRDGGTLILGKKRYTIEKLKELEIAL